MSSDRTAVIAGGVPSSWVNEVSAWRDITAVAIGIQHAIGLKSDGTAIMTEAWNLEDVSGWRNIIAI